MCRFCYERLKECPHCKEPYDPKNIRIIKNVFYELTESERRQQLVLDMSRLIIKNIPLELQDKQTLQ